MFGKRLLMARKQKGLSQTKMGELLKITRQAYCHYENGKREPTQEVLKEISKILNCSIDYLLGNTNDPRPVDKQLAEINSAIYSDENKDSDNSKEKQIFSKKLNFYMDKKGITQADIVSKFGITASTVSDWCNGKKYPRSDKVRMLANFLGVLKSDLVEDSPLEEGTLIFNRNGEIIRKKFSEEQMKYLEKFISSLTDEDYPDL